MGCTTSAPSAVATQPAADLTRVTDEPPQQQQQQEEEEEQDEHHVYATYASYYTEEFGGDSESEEEEEESPSGPPVVSFTRYFCSAGFDWVAHAHSTPCPRGLLPYFVCLINALRKDEFNAITLYSASNTADPDHRPVILSKQALDEQLRPLASSHVQAGNFGQVSVCHLQGDVNIVDDEFGDDGRTMSFDCDVFVKRQERSMQFWIEVACLSTVTDWALPTPRLIALHQDIQASPPVTVMAIALSGGEPAHKYFAEPRPVETKLRCAIMFAFSLQCCHTHHVIHNDVALRNFMTDAESCFEIVDFGLAVIGDGTLPIPYPHKIVAAKQAAPEHTGTVSVSPATDVYQFGWLLQALFFGADTIGNPVSFQRDEVPPADAVLAGVHEIIDRCLLPDPAGRATTADVIRSLGALLDLPTDILASAQFYPQAAIQLRLAGSPLRSLLPPLKNLLSERPANAIESILDDSVTTLELDHGVGPAVLHTVVEALRASPLSKMTHVNLSGNDLTDDDLVVLVDALRLADNPVIVEITLNNNRISDPSPLVVARTLTDIYLHGNHITDVSPLAPLLQDNDRLNSLSLGNNQITDVSPLAEPLSTNTCLEYLILEDNQIAQVSALVTALRSNDSLSVLGLEGNALSEQDKTALDDEFGVRFDKWGIGWRL